MADFELQPDLSAGFVFVAAADEQPGPGNDDELREWCCRHIELGVRAELAERFGTSLPAVRVVLRKVLVHPVDSSESHNQAAGRELVRSALERLDDQLAGR